MHIDVLLFVEHIDREYRIAQLLANELSDKYGFRVAIASTIFQGVSSLWKFYPRVVVTPSTALAKGSCAWMADGVWGEDVEFINLNYEQFLSSWRGSYKISSNPISRTRQYQCVWGPYFKKILLESGTQPDLILETGRPYDQLLSKLKGNKEETRIQLSDETKLADYDKTVFFALTDGLAFMTNTRINTIVSYGADKEMLLEHIQWVKRGFVLMMDFLDSLTKEYPSYLFVLRPHPSIPISSYKPFILERKLDLAENLLITKQHSAPEWLSISDLFVTNYSTLSIDARLLGVPTVCISDDPDYDYDQYWYSRGCRIVTQEYQIKEAIGGIATKTGRSREVSDLDSMPHIDHSKNGIGETAKAINQVINKLDNKRKHHISTFRIALRIFIQITKAPRRLLGSLARLACINLNINPFGIIPAGILEDSPKKITQSLYGF